MPRPVSRICGAKFEVLVECFVGGLPARHAAAAAGVNRSTALLHFGRLRELIARRLDRTPAPWADCADLVTDAAAAQPASGLRRVRPLYGLIEQDGSIRFLRLEGPGAGSGAEGAAPALDALVCACEYAPSAGAPARRRLCLRMLAHLARDRGRRRVVKRSWSQTLRQLSRFNGVSLEHLYLYLKECEWRLAADSPQQRMQLLRAWLVDDA